MRKFLSTSTLAVFMLAGALAVSYTLVRAPHTFGQFQIIEDNGDTIVRGVPFDGNIPEDPDPAPSTIANGRIVYENVAPFGCDVGTACGTSAATCQGSFRKAKSGTGWSVARGGNSIQITNSAGGSMQTQAVNLNLVNVDDDGSGTGWSKNTCAGSCSVQSAANCAGTLGGGTVWTSNTAETSVAISGRATNKLAPNGSAGTWGGFNAYYQIKTLVCDTDYVVNDNKDGCVGDIEKKGVLKLSTQSLNFDGIVGQSSASNSPQTVVIFNRGTASLNWDISANQTWCKVSPTSGTSLPTNGTAQVSVSVDAPPPATPGLSTGDNPCKVTFTNRSNTNDPPQDVNVNYVISSAPPIGKAIMSLDKNALAFNAVTGGAPVSASQTLKVINALTATANLTWNAVETTGNGCSYFTFAPISRSGQAPGDSTSVLLEASPATSPGIYTCQVRFTGVSDGSGQTADGSPQELNLTYNVSDVPAPTCTLSKTAVAVGEPVSATAAGGNGAYAWSASPDGTPNPAQGGTTSIAFPSAGTKTVTVQSGDKNGTCSLTVNDALSCTLSAAPNPVTVNNPTTLSAQGFGGAGGYTYKYNCTSDGPYTRTTPSCTYTSAGNYTPHVKVTDSAGAAAVCSTAPTAVQVTPPPTLSVSLEVATDAASWSSSLSRPAPLTGVDFRASAAGTAAGDIRYRFYCDATDATPVVETISASNPWVAPDANCTAYLTPGTYQPKVVLEREGLSASATATVTVTTTPANADLIVSLSVNPATGPAPLSSRLTASVSGTSTGTINYSFWWNCNSATANVSSAASACGALPAPAPGSCVFNSIGAKCDGIATLGMEVTNVYSATGTYHPKVIVERGTAAPAESRTTITVTGVATHAECVNNACVQVSGAGVSRCTTGADCSIGGGGGGSGSFFCNVNGSCTSGGTGRGCDSNSDCTGGGTPVHAECDAGQRACVNAAGAGSNTCGSDVACGGSTASHLECQNNACVIVGGAGTNECPAVGLGCSGPVGGVGAPVCTFAASKTRVIIPPPASVDLSWSCVGTLPVSCTLSAGGATIITSGESGDRNVFPAVTTIYNLSCRNSGGTDTQSVKVRVFNSNLQEILPQ